MCRRCSTCLSLIALALLTACTGSGRARVVTNFLEAEIEYYESAVGLNVVECGVITVDGRVYRVFCNSDGEPVFLEPVEAPGRRVPVRPRVDVELHGTVPANAVPFVLDGAELLMMPLPTPLLDIAWSGTAEQLLADFGVSVGPGGYDIPYQYTVDPVSGDADIRIAFSGDMALPDPFDLPLHFETIVVESTSGGPPFVYHRTAGPIGLVLEYAQAAGVVELVQVSPHAATPETGLAP
jgi:hypothetical protein